MGLDMYLYKERYTSVHTDEELYRQLAALLEVPDNDQVMRHITAKWPAAQWRKANQIHAWFVDNVQGGEDDCGHYYVSIEQLTELRDLCKEALRENNADLLPPQSGFFFGSTEVDEWYWGDIEHTIQMLTQVINDHEGGLWDYSYHSSW